jgi:hypothetical protein
MGVLVERNVFLVCVGVRDGMIVKRKLERRWYLNQLEFNGLKDWSHEP